MIRLEKVAKTERRAKVTLDDVVAALDDPGFEFDRLLGFLLGHSRLGRALLDDDDAAESSAARVVFAVTGSLLPKAEAFVARHANDLARLRDEAWAIEDEVRAARRTAPH